MRRKSLLRIYKLYATWAGKFDFACRKGCATCCTQSVSMTMLEGELIHEYIKSEKTELMDILDKLPASSSNQKTTNQFAAACLKEEDGVDNLESWNMASCVFLQDNCCSIYPVRSFMCRSFGSKVPCDVKGEAEIEPLFLTLNTVILQCIEHLDQGRPWGNMNTILRMIRNTDFEEPGRQMEDVPISNPIPGFLIPPDEVDSLRSHLRTLMEIIGSRRFWES